MWERMSVCGKKEFEVRKWIETNEFLTLSTVLGAMSAIYTDHKVRLHSPTQNCPLTNPSIGIHCDKKQDPNPPLIRQRTGGTF